MSLINETNPIWFLCSELFTRLEQTINQFKYEKEIEILFTQVFDKRYKIYKEEEIDRIMLTRENILEQFYHYRSIVFSQTELQYMQLGPIPQLKSKARQYIVPYVPSNACQEMISVNNHFLPEMELINRMFIMSDEFEERNTIDIKKKQNVPNRYELSDLIQSLTMEDPLDFRSRDYENSLEEYRYNYLCTINELDTNLTISKHNHIFHKYMSDPLGFNKPDKRNWADQLDET